MATRGRGHRSPTSQRLAAPRHRHRAAASASPGQFTAQAFITTDLDDNQITAFHPGRDEPFAREPRRRATLGAGLGIIAPDGKEGMLQHAREFAAAGIPFMFDPGQGLPMFSGEELRRVRASSPTTSRSTTTKARCWRRTPAASSRRSRASVEGAGVTLGAEGSVIYAGGERHEIPCVPGRGGGRSHRLRRRLPRGAALRHRARLGLAEHRQARLGDGRAQDRAARRAEPHRLARRRSKRASARRSATRPGKASPVKRGSSPRTPRAFRAADSSPAR